MLEGTTIAEPASPTRERFTFAGWYTDAGYATAWNFLTSTVTSDTTLHAKWDAIPEYTVTFNSQGGSAVASLVEVLEGTTIAAPTAPTRSGYTFAGWYTDASYVTAWNFLTSTVTIDTTLYAKWDAIPSPSTGNQTIYYTVSFDSQGGSIIGSNQIIAGAAIAEPIAPAKSGYSFDGWYTEATNGSRWEFSSNKVTKNITLYAKWTAIPVGITFSDIANHWAREAIIKAVQAGIVSGYPDGTFNPNRAVTRAEFLVMLMNARNSSDAGADLVFTDAEKIPTWAKQAIAQAVQAGIINGYEDGSLRPDAIITRAEMASMIAKILELDIEANAVTSFSDDTNIQAWAKGAIAALEKLELMQGTGANQFNATSFASRAQAVTIIIRMLELKD